MMERLTKRTAQGRAVFAKNAPPFEQVMDLPAIMERLAAYEDTGLEPDQVDQIRRASEYMMFESVGDFVRYEISNFEALEKYRNAEAEGRLVVLPCKTGDTIYQLRGKNHAQGIGISPRIVSCAHVWSNGDYSLSHQGMAVCRKKDLGKTWFLTLEEAEAALEAQKGVCLE